jgi:FKBP-type peptidyl-prolyl cis-trans isomerase FkpA
MKRFFVALIFFLQALQGVAQSGVFAVLPDGLEYQFIRNIGKRKPKQGEVCVMHMQYMTEQDSILFDSRDFGEPLLLNMQKPDFRGGIESGLELMGEGDSAIFKVVADSVFEKTFLEPLPPGIEPGSKIIYRVGMMKVRTVDELLDEEDKVEKEKKAAIEKRKGNEAGNIKQYLKLNQIENKPFDSGAILVSTKRGKGKVAAKGQKVSFWYTARTLEGTLYDTNIEAEALKAGANFSDRSFEPLEIVMGARQVFPGLEEGLSHILPGGKARLIIPSALAYGSMQVGNLPPYSPLVYEIEVLEIK